MLMAASYNGHGGVMVAWRRHVKAKCMKSVVMTSNNRSIDNDVMAAAESEAA